MALKSKAVSRERPDDLVVAHIYSYRHEAEIGRSALEANGIEAMIKADDCGSQEPYLSSNTGVKLLVRRADGRKARTLLE